MMFPNLVWDIVSIPKTLFLTFDDGPTLELTQWILNTLNTYHAKATFFCIGNNIELHPDLFKSIINAGHTVGNHTYNHLNGWQHDHKKYLSNITQTQNLFKAFNVQSNLFRPPYGKLSLSQINTLKKNYKIIMWDVLSFDWDKQVCPEKCLNYVLNNAKHGSIIVFHDNVKAANNMQYTLPKVLAYFSEKGYQFKAIPYTN